MTRKATAVPAPLQVWIVARQGHGLSHAHVQMARELGMNPRRLGKLDKCRLGAWKSPLPVFIEQMYLRRFGRERPEVVVPLEERARPPQRKKPGRAPDGPARRKADAGE